MSMPRSLASLSRTLALAGVLALAPSATAQEPVEPGFARTAQQPGPGGAYRTLSSGERVVFDGVTVDLYDAAGQFLANLGSLPGFVFSSFVAVNPSETFALIGESSNGDVFRVDLSGGGLTFLAQLNFNYDAVFLDDGVAVVSASLCGFGCGSDLVRLDAHTGAVTSLAALPGASGPVAVGSNGALYYATVSGSFPPPPGSTQIVRWSPAQVASGAVLSLGDATLLADGLDGASSLDVDHVRGGIVLAESIFGATSTIKLFSAGGGLVSNVLAGPDWISDIELMQGPGGGHFYPFQPANGVFLHYSSNGVVHTIRPRRPQASVTQLGNIATVTVTGAYPDSALLLLHGPQSLWTTPESTYAIPGLGFLVQGGMDPRDMKRMHFLTPTDSRGKAVFSYYDPGNLAGTLVFQALVLGGSGQFQGASTGAFN